MMKKLYRAVAVPKMLYTIEAWETTMLQKRTSKKEKGWNARGFTKKIESVQCIAAICITGGMQYTATNILFTHADLLPILALIRKHISWVALCLSTLPLSHPLCKEFKSALQGRRRHKSLLHHIAETFRFNHNDFKTITSAVVSQKWTSKVQIQSMDNLSQL